jgi:glycosyltransferase involved in cell wall biosynthesis
MSTPKVSILLPCFNAAPFLEERIDSILAQTFSDWEAIVLDSYSDDGSWEFFQSIASSDSRFRLYQIPREGVYAALNRGIELATGEFLHVATCDDTMVPEFLTAMLELFAQCPEAGIAACDVFLINRGGGELTAKDMADYLPVESINDLLGLTTVRCAYPRTEQQLKLNYRPPPHDCLLHFSTKSVYFSLTQLLIRTTLARSIEPFDTTVGSIADLGWLLRLTNLAGTVHVPQKLAIWRFRGNQLSIQPDRLRLNHVKAMFERAVPQIYRQHQRLLTRNECGVLMLPAKAYLAVSKKTRRRLKLEAFIRVLWMFFRKPAATLRAIHRTQFSIQTLKGTLVPMFFARSGLAPEDIHPTAIRRAIHGETSLHSGAFHEAEK